MQNIGIDHGPLEIPYDDASPCGPRRSNGSRSRSRSRSQSRVATPVKSTASDRLRLTRSLCTIALALSALPASTSTPLPAILLALDSSIRSACHQTNPTSAAPTTPVDTTDDEPVDFAEGLEAEDAGGVVGDGGVVEWAVEDEEGDVGVAGGETVRDAA
ncbi:hypothetical protein CNMCM6106_009203 [Aspergillus hiratsukae]|uniref:Uncharacterized protein n=1 Tax=Aspergillus hiratsukae TaxID=1194566 RepID=A0A8H6QL85_9EURO|nr:hypothetical protein CNMCM6106_009203 [Aspergillus hiratsukae]